jgi:hypothetical protein
MMGNDPQAVERLDARDLAKRAVGVAMLFVIAFFAVSAM